MPEFKVLKGGLVGPATEKYRFQDAVCTDTRLMGVLGLRVHWKDMSDPLDPEDIYHFYYYDIEEIGLDYLQVSKARDEEELALLTKRNFGGLGAGFWPLSEQESRYLICRFVEETKRKRQPLPENIADIGFILRDPVELTPEQKRNLDLKLCTMIRTDYGIVNYYLMRLFGKDPEGAALLVSADADPADLEDVSLPKHATFLKNKIEEFTDETGTSYLCESLVESSDTHWIVVSEITLSGGKVRSCRRRSAFKVSSAEASMKTSRREYITVYEIIADMEVFDRCFDDFTAGATRTGHETGEMFMCFRPDNSHAEKQEFALSDDIETLYYVTDYGQLISAAHTIKDIQNSELLLSRSELSDKIYPTARYNFDHGVIYDFAISGFTDFEDFLDAVTGKI